MALAVQVAAMHYLPLKVPLGEELDHYLNPVPTWVLHPLHMVQLVLRILSLLLQLPLNHTRLLLHHMLHLP